MDNGSGPEGSEAGVATGTQEAGGTLNWDQFNENHPKERIGGQGVDTQAAPGPNYVQAKETSTNLSMATETRAAEVKPLSGQGPRSESPAPVQTVTETPAAPVAVEPATSPAGQRVEGTNIRIGGSSEAMQQAIAQQNAPQASQNEVGATQAVEPSKKSLFDRIFRR